MATDPAAFPFDPARFFAGERRQGHDVALGIRYVDHGADWCELKLDYDRRLAADATSGVLASGPIVSLIDMASGCATWVRLGRFAPTATLDLRIDYLRAARPGRAVHGRAECYRLTRRVAFVRGVAHDGDPDHLIAHTAATFMLNE